MIVIKNNLIPFKGYAYIMLYGALFTRKDKKISGKTLRHESIHVRQFLELSAVGLFLSVLSMLLLGSPPLISLLLGVNLFYIWYLVSWLIRLFRYGPSKGYDNSYLEQEAYKYESVKGYLHTRRWFAWVEFIFDKK